MSAIDFHYTITIQDRQVIAGWQPQTASESGIIEVTSSDTRNDVFNSIFTRLAKKHSIKDPLLISFSLEPDEFLRWVS
jgi:hypothetical protein